MSGRQQSRAHILKSLHDDLAAAEREYARVEALNIRSGNVENVERNNELERLLGVIEGTQRNINELEAEPENAMQNESPAPSAVQGHYSKEKRRAALRALEERKKTRRAAEERRAAENADIESEIFKYYNRSAPSAHTVSNTAYIPHSPVRKQLVAPNTNMSPRFNIIWEEPAMSPHKWHEFLSRRAASRRAKQLAELSPNWRMQTGPANPSQKRPNARAIRYGPLRKWSGNTTARRINFSGQRRITNYLKLRNRAMPPKNATRRNRK